MVGGNKLWWDVEKNTQLLVKYGQVPAKYIYKELIVKNIVGDPSLMLIRRTLFEQAGLFRTDLRIGADWEMWLRIAKYTSIGFIEIVQGFFCKRDQVLPRQFILFSS
jgi:hypothetical protein